jgi:signal transduction histidine kinase
MDDVSDYRWDLERDLLDAVAGAASGQDLRETLRALVEGAVEMLGATYGALGVREEDGSLRDFIHVGMDEETVARIGKLPVGRGVLGLIRDEKAPVVIDDLATHPESVGFPPGHPPMTSFIGTAVRVRGIPYGNLYLTGKRDAPAFDAEDARTLNAFAGAAGLAVENARLFEVSSRREQWLRATTEVTTAILSGAAAEDVLDLVARRAQECARADGVAIMLADADDQMVVEIAIGDAADSFIGMRADAEWSYSSTVAATGRPVVLDDLGALRKSNDPAFTRLGPCMLLPLLAADRTLGAIAISNYRGGRRWDGTDLALAEAFAGQTAMALVLAESQREQERLAVYVDRDRIARDLHDLVIQRLFAAGMALEGSRRRGEIPAQLDERIGSVVSELDETVREIRQTIFALQGPEDPAPTTPALRARVLREAAVAGSALGFAPRVHVDEDLDAAVPPAIIDHLVAALRETLANVVRHAHASGVEVSISRDGDALRLVVEDDGVGLFPGDRRSGLANLEQRAGALGGGFSLEPVRGDGSGTRVTWTASLEPAPTP